MSKEEKNVYSLMYPMNRAYLYQNYNKFLQDLLMAASEEAQAIDFYTRVLQIAPTETVRRDFQHSLEDEKEHYRLFTELYTSLTGRRARVPEFQPVHMYLSTNDPMARDIMLRGFTDEGEHAIRFTYQRALLGAKNN